MRQITLYKIKDKKGKAKLFSCDWKYVEEMSNKGYRVTGKIKKILG